MGPTVFVETEAPGGHHTMHVGMKTQVAGPGMKHGGDAETGIPAITCETSQNPGRGAEKQAVDCAGKATSKRAQLSWQREDHVVMPDREDLLGPFLDPTTLVERLALGTVTVAA